jgi:hypothetical protein
MLVIMVDQVFVDQVFVNQVFGFRPCSLAGSGGINQRKLRGCYPSIEINACVDEGNTDPVTVFPQETAQGSTDLEISARIIRAGPMKPIVGQAYELCDLSCLDLYVHLRVAEKASSYRALCFLDKSGNCLRAQVDTFDQVGSPIKDKVFENTFDERPHSVGCLQIVVFRVDAKRRRSQVEAHLRASSGNQGMP